MPVHHAVLALLHDGPSYGYELKGNFEDAVGPQYGELNIGHLYQVLDRMVRDGMVTRSEVEQSRRPDKVEYRLTDAGAAELNSWLGQPHLRHSGYRDDFFLKLFAATRLGVKALRRVLATQREADLREIAALSQLRRTHGADALVGLLIEAALSSVKANLETVEAAERQATDLCAAARARRRSGRRAVAGTEAS